MLFLDEPLTHSFLDDMTSVDLLVLVHLLKWDHES